MVLDEREDGFKARDIYYIVMDPVVYFIAMAWKGRTRYRQMALYIVWHSLYGVQGTSRKPWPEEDVRILACGAHVHCWIECLDHIYPAFRLNGHDSCIQCNDPKDSNPGIIVDVRYTP